jgi:hypothetical protein
VEDTSQGTVEKAQRERDHYRSRRESICRCYASWCIEHGVSPARNQPALIPDYAHKASALRAGKVGGAALALCVFVALNVMSLEGPLLLVILISAFFGLLLGAVAICIVSRCCEVDAMNPESTAFANRLLVAGGLSAIVAFAAFCFIRLSESQFTATILPYISVLVELGGLTFVGAATVLLPVYEWPENYVRDYAEADRIVRKLDNKIAAYRLHAERKDFSHASKDSPKAFGSSPSLNSDDRSASKPSKPNGSSTDYSGLC